MVTSTPPAERLDVETGKDVDEPRPPATRMLRMARPDFPLVGGGMLALLGATACSLALPALFGRIVDALTQQGGDAVARLEQAALALFVVSLVNGAFSFMSSLAFRVAGERIVRRIRRALFASLLLQEVAFFDRTMTGELVNRLSSDCTKLSDLMTIDIAMTMRWVATIVGGIIYLFIVSWRLSLVMVSVVPLVGVAARVFGGYVRALGHREQDALAEATTTASESLTHIRTVKAFGQEAPQEGRYGERVDAAYAIGVRVAWALAWFRSLLGAVANSVFVVLLYLGGLWTIEGHITVGGLSSFMLFSVQIGAAFAGIAGIFGKLSKALGASERVFSLMDREPAIWGSNGTQGNSAGSGEVSFRDVHFGYPSRPDVPAMRSFSLRMAPGTVTALVGASGAGKSTAINLLLRFYDPDSGAVEVDGTDVRSLDLRSLRRRIAVVSQEPILFAASLRDNILYGRPDASEEEVERAAALAHADEFISQCPEGLDTMAGERGVRLSGGQKQRIALARAILADPSILLLDEATSALDAHSEHRVQEALTGLMRGRTVLVIAHRLSTVRDADVVAVVERGTVVATGTHDELQRTSDTYARLVRHQLQSPTPAAAPEDVVPEVVERGTGLAQ